MRDVHPKRCHFRGLFLKDNDYSNCDYYEDFVLREIIYKGKSILNKTRASLFYDDTIHFITNKTAIEIAKMFDISWQRVHQIIHGKRK